MSAFNYFGIADVEERRFSDGIEKGGFCLGLFHENGSLMTCAAPASLPAVVSASRAHLAQGESGNPARESRDSGRWESGALAPRLVASGEGALAPGKL